MSTLETLWVEISTDPLLVGYATMTDGEIAASMNAKNRSLVKVLAAEKFLLWAADGGRLQKLRNTFENTSKSVAIRTASRALYIPIEAFQDIDPSDTRWNTLLNALVSDGTLTQSDKNALVDEATILVSRANELGITEVTVGLIVEARQWGADNG
jgi:hypothetical protein